MEIKQLAKEDIPELLNLRIEQQKEYHECLNEEEKSIVENTRKYLEENLNKDFYMFGAYINGELVSICGYIVWLSLPTMTNIEGRIAYLCSAYTKTEYRGQGIIKELLNKSLEECKKHGIKRIKLNSSKENAIKTYSKLGFVKDETAMILDL